MTDDEPGPNDRTRPRTHGDPDGRRRSRTSGLIRIALARFRGQLTGVQSGKSTAIVVAVALTLALLVVVTGLALALVDGGGTSQTDADVSIEPADGGSLSSVNGIESPRLANATAHTAELRAADGVDRATPVLVEPVAVRSETASTADPSAYTRLLAIGVDPAVDAGSVAGLPLDALGDGDDGADDADGRRSESGAENESAAGTLGARSAGLVLSETAANRLDVTVGEAVVVTSGTETYQLPVTAVEPTTGDDEAPVALVDRDALMTFAGSADASLADRILLWGDEGAAERAAADAYPAAAVEPTDSIHPAALFENDLALATSLVATIVALVVCALFIATTAGMAVAEDRPQLAILSAIGFSGASRLAIVTTAILTTVIGGSVLGVVLGIGVGYGVNALAGVLFATGSVVVFHPLVVPYTVVVAVVAGLLALPYPLSIAARTDVLAAVDG
ncbi:ABC-type transport system, involved in lipoprotein release, permease component [Halovivax ruber XH-70]|uniref:ABC-type transport system, involved in lipoprotein release, permease component n=1 Tax=Halovivax ruber (strain DSM 18193 / JCM 13892 / XH-70) TaxID=797302 RepID=L0IBN7_HALRX|nr:FtsX-like permease family protein [Halovivax ruber]AGB16980.1 ABC-type transport system, involved in lipoprotein release, permease component [Halovivax ruber XH-70]